MAADFEANDCEGKDIRQTLEHWRDSARNRAERPDWFWTRQHARLMSKVAEPSVAGFPKLAWASLAATIAIAASLILPLHPGRQVERQAHPIEETQISDHDLMIAIERSMNQGVPSSLAPASLLANEMNQALAAQVQSQKAKEKRYAN